MNTKTIDSINILLVFIAFVLAMWLPFELFIFSYVILGPLHYLTEISWLEQRQFFTQKKKDFWLLAILCCLASIGFISKNYIEADWIKNDHLSAILTFLGEYTTHMVFIAFVMSIAFVFLKKSIYRYFTLALSIVGALLLEEVNSYILLFAIFLPTIIHVYFFTGTFMLYGAIKNKSRLGYLSIIVFLICGATCLFWELLPIRGEILNYVKNSLVTSKFHVLNHKIYQLLVPGDEAPYQIFDATISFQIQRFMAFAYTYHYLNWFSKTKIIQWHQVSTQRIISMGVIWLGTILLFAFNFHLGYTLLLFMSLLHVFLEFPLNHKTFGSLYAMILPKKSN